MSVAEEVERQVAVAVAIAVEEPPFLVAVQRVVWRRDRSRSPSAARRWPPGTASRTGLRWPPHCGRSCDSVPARRPPPPRAHAPAAIASTCPQPARSPCAALRAFRPAPPSGSWRSSSWSQLQRTANRTDHPAVEGAHNSTPFNGSEIERILPTLCRHRGGPPSRAKPLLHN